MGNYSSVENVNESQSSLWDPYRLSDAQQQICQQFQVNLVTLLTNSAPEKYLKSLGVQDSNQSEMLAYACDTWKHLERHHHFE